MKMKITSTVFLFLCLVFCKNTIADTLPVVASTITSLPTQTLAVKQQIYTFGIKKFRVNSSFNSWEKCDHVYPDDFISLKTDTNGISLAEKNRDTLRLWINGICYQKLKPLFINRNDCTLIFKLSYDTAQSSPWQLFYESPNYWTFEHHVKVNLGTLKTEFPPAKSSAIDLYTTSYFLVITGYLIFVLILLLIYKFGKTIIRDVGTYAQEGATITFNKDEPTSAANGIINIKDVPYSLSKTQFLFWLLIIFFCIIHIWVITDTLTTPTGTVLLLLGISSGTFYIGRLIDNNKLANAPVKTPAEYVSEFIAKGSVSKGFMSDILNDGNGISLHRLQLVMFTIFLGVYFLWHVLYGLDLPQFSDTMMLLMGISSGTYAGVKTTEK